MNEKYYPGDIVRTRMHNRQYQVTKCYPHDCYGVVDVAGLTDVYNHFDLALVRRGPNVPPEPPSFGYLALAEAVEGDHPYKAPFTDDRAETMWLNLLAVCERRWKTGV